MIGIYKIENKVNKKAYIGQSIHIEQRWLEHKQPSIYNNPNHKSYSYALYEAFRKYGIDNFEFSIIEECSKEQLNEREKYWIQYYDSYNNGYNMTLGGDGVAKEGIIPVYIYNIQGQYIREFKNVQEAAKILNCNENSIYSAVSSKGLYLKYQWRYEKVESLSYYETDKHRPVIAFDLNGNKIKVYDTIKEAMEKTKDSELKITSQCKTKIYNNTRYQWRYYLENPNLEYISSSVDNSLHIINQYDLNGNFIKTFSSLKEAALELSLNVSNLTTTLKGLQKSYGGFLWSNYGEPAPMPYKDNRLNHITSSNKRQIIQFTKQNELIQIYESAHEAARQIGKSKCANHITECCQGKRKTCEGYIWKYKES